MAAMASQITSLTIVNSAVYSGAVKKNLINFLHKWPVTRKMFPFDDVIMRPSRQSSHCIILSSFSHTSAHILHDTSSIMSFGCRPELELSTVQSTSPGIVLPTNLGCSVCFTSSRLSLCREETQYLNELEPGFSTYQISIPHYSV